MYMLRYYKIKNIEIKETKFCASNDHQANDRANLETLSSTYSVGVIILKFHKNYYDMTLCFYGIKDFYHSLAKTKRNI